MQVITDEQMQRDIIKSMHEGLGAKFVSLQKTNAELHSIHVPNKIWTQIGDRPNGYTEGD